MDFLSGLKKIGGVIGDVAGLAAPAVKFIPGIGPIASAGLKGLSKIGDFAKDNAGTIIGGLSAIQGARQSKRASDLQSEALDFARQQYADRGGARDMGLERLKALPPAGSTRTTAPNLRDAGNPYARIG